MRLNQYLAACGLGSRRRCEELIAAGRVRMNAEPVHFGTRVGPADQVQVDDRTVRPPARAGVWLLHKPAGVVCTARDELGRPTVLELARAQGLGERLFSVGRLDRETTGLLLLTDDGALAFRLTHPSYGIEKEYEARVAVPLPEIALARLREGIELEDGRTSPCRVAQEGLPEGALVRLVLHEGRKRQVRRMLAAAGAPVLALHRVRVGPLLLTDLRPGDLRPATASEYAALHAAVAAPRAATDAAPGAASS